MKINPVKGTADYLPSQTLLRDYLQNIILETYREAGFERIMTPAIEDMENLEKTITDYINESGDWVKRAKTNEGIITLPPDFEEFERYIGKSGFKIELDNKGQYWLETKDKRIALSVADLMGLVRSSRATVSALAQSLLDQPAEN